MVVMGGQYLRSYVFDCAIAGIHFCFSGYFCAYEKSILSFLHNLAAIVLVRIPGAYLASIYYPDTLFPHGHRRPGGVGLLRPDLPGDVPVPTKKEGLLSPKQQKPAEACQLTGFGGLWYTLARYRCIRWLATSLRREVPLMGDFGKQFLRFLICLAFFAYILTLKVC